jgi:methyltransferase (TIGR00027 family)
VDAGKPSRTAWAAAAHRAAHQSIEGGRIFSDPLAARILGEECDAIARDAEAHPSRRRMRIFIAARTRIAEDALATAVELGVSQLVVLGAGLDTYAYRNAFADRLRVFEVDHPATQVWKRQRLDESGIPLPSSLTFAPVDFERQSLAEGLAAAGFDRARQTFFTWLGVVPYLSEEAVLSTLTFIAGVPGGAHVVFDYGDPPETLTTDERAVHDRRAAHVEALGERWVTFFEASALRATLTSLGFRGIDDRGPREIAARFYPARAAAAPDKGGHVVRATTIR